MMRRRQICEWWYRIRWGHWCDHRVGIVVLDLDGLPGLRLSTFTPWRIVDAGRRKHRWCTECGRAEWV